MCYISSRSPACASQKHGGDQLAGLPVHAGSPSGIGCFETLVKGSTGPANSSSNGAQMSSVQRRARLKELSTSPDFILQLKVADTAKAQYYADKGIFKILCFNLHDLTSEAALRSIAGLTSLLEKLPDLTLRAWEYGAIGPITELLRKAVAQKKLKVEDKTELLWDESLVTSVRFLAAMGTPLRSALTSQPATNTSMKFFRWLSRKEMLLPTARLWIALTQVRNEGPFLYSREFYSALYGASSIVFHSARLDLQLPDLASLPGMLAGLPLFFAENVTSVFNFLSSLPARKLTLRNEKSRL
jgi:hypothetical protein